MGSVQFSGNEKRKKLKIEKGTERKRVAFGATTLSIKALSIMTYSTAINKHNTQRNDIQHNNKQTQHSA